MLVMGLAREGGVVVLVAAVAVAAVAAVVAVVVETVGMVRRGGGGQFVDPPGVEDLGFRFLGYGVLGFRVWSSTSPFMSPTCLLRVKIVGSKV
jgi:hypothetical protein